LDFLESNPLPKFEPGKGPFKEAAKKYSQELTDYHAKAMENTTRETDCSGEPGPLECP
jgi:hypothetical protein